MPLVEGQVKITFIKAPKERRCLLERPPEQQVLRKADRTRTWAVYPSPLQVYGSKRD